MDRLDTEPISGSGSPIQILCIEHNLGFLLGFRLTGPVQQFATAWADSGSDKNYDADAWG